MGAEERPARRETCEVYGVAVDGDPLEVRIKTSGQPPHAPQQGAERYTATCVTLAPGLRRLRACGSLPLDPHARLVIALLGGDGRVLDPIVTRRCGRLTWSNGMRL
jgi:hypothetical protein